jgi:hypothetical protein
MSIVGFLAGLNLIFPCSMAFLNVEAEDYVIIGAVVGNIVELAVFFPFKFFSRRDPWFAGNLNCFFSSSKSKVLSAFLTSKS